MDSRFNISNLNKSINNLYAHREVNTTEVPEPERVTRFFFSSALNSYGIPELNEMTMNAEACSVSGRTGNLGILTADDIKESTFKSEIMEKEENLIDKWKSIRTGTIKIKKVKERVRQRRQVQVLGNITGMSMFKENDSISKSSARKSKFGKGSRGLTVSIKKPTFNLSSKPFVKPRVSIVSVARTIRAARLMTKNIVLKTTMEQGDSSPPLEDIIYKEETKINSKPQKSSPTIPLENSSSEPLLLGVKSLLSKPSNPSIFECPKDTFKKPSKVPFEPPKVSFEKPKVAFEKPQKAADKPSETANKPPPAINIPIKTPTFSGDIPPPNVKPPAVKPKPPAQKPAPPAQKPAAAELKPPSLKPTPRPPSALDDDFDDKKHAHKPKEMTKEKKAAMIEKMHKNMMEKNAGRESEKRGAQDLKKPLPKVLAGRFQGGLPMGMPMGAPMGMPMGAPMGMPRRPTKEDDSEVVVAEETQARRPIRANRRPPTRPKKD